MKSRVKHKRAEKTRGGEKKHKVGHTLNDDAMLILPSEAKAHSSIGEPLCHSQCEYDELPYCL